MPELSEAEHEEAERRGSLRADVVHEAIRKEGEDELRRSSSALAWSGLAAGLSMGFSLVAEGLIRSHLPDAPWRPLIAKFGYSVGYLIVILGRQQLFTENTLTVILPLLARRDGRTLLQVLRLWSVVLIFNLLGVHIFAWVIGNSTVFSPLVRTTFGEIGREAIVGSFWTILLKGVFAGWLIALMVWLLPAADSARVPIIIIITFLVGLAGLSHIIAGSLEALYIVMTGELAWLTFVSSYLVPTLIGNILGGVTLVAMINHAQVVAGTDDKSGSKSKADTPMKQESATGKAE